MNWLNYCHLKKYLGDVRVGWGGASRAQHGHKDVEKVPVPW